jgi:hypothetical protein
MPMVAQLTPEVVVVQAASHTADGRRALDFVEASLAAASHG